MENSESDYSEDFEEEELISSAAAPSSKPSAASLSVRRRQRGDWEDGGERGAERMRQKEVLQPREEKCGAPSRGRAPAKQPMTTSKSTGGVRRALADETRPSRRTQSFLPRRLQPKEKGSKLFGSSPARDRQLSAMNHTIRGLQNKLSERSKKLDELSKENRLLNRLQRRHDREWSKIQRQEDELPQILQRHDQEVRALRKQLRKSHEEVVAGQQRLGELQDEIQRLSDTNHKLEKVVGKKRLLERDQLTVQLQQTRQQLADREKRVAELERGLEATSKTHAQEMRGLRLRNRALASETNTFRDTANQLHSQLKEKTKEMDVLNIYTQRIPRTTARPLLPSPTQPPQAPAVTHQASQTALSCPPFKTVSMQHRSQLKAVSSQTDVVTADISKSSRSVDTATQTVSETVPTIAVSPAKTAARAVEVRMETISPVHEDTDASEAVVAQPQELDSSPKDGQVETEKSKHTLIQRLRELDSQKITPGSNPMPPVQTSGSATTVTMATTQPHPLQSLASSRVTTAPPSEVKPSISQAEVEARERERKQLLLAKLMAIDDGSDPNHVKMIPVEARITATNKMTSSSSSVTCSSWPDIVENMHQGKPAHASEDDPFGSRTRLSSSKKILVKGRTGGTADIEAGGRRQMTFMTEDSEPSPSAVPGRWGLGENHGKPSPLQPGEGGGGYRPSFGRRAANAAANAARPTVQNGAGRPTCTDQQQPPRPSEDKDLSGHSVFGDLPSLARGLLPRRPKAEAAAMRSYDVMPGAVVSEPDDLEELVL